MDMWVSQPAIGAAGGLAAVPSPAYDLVIFDFDGTLADSVTWFASVVNDVARRYRFKEATPEDLQALRNEDALSVLRHLEVAHWKIPFIARHMRRLMAREIDKIALFPGVEDLLEDLSRAGVRLAIVSSNGPANVRKVLGPRTAALIDHLACGASLFGKTAKFRAVLDQSDVPPQRVIAIGDEVRDIEAATMAGIDSGTVSWGYATSSALAARRPTVMFDTIAAIAPFILGRADG